MASSILVVIGEHGWTLRALHLAGAMAREASVPVVILKLVRVGHLEYLGAGAHEALLPYDEFEALQEYEAVADRYVVPATLQFFEYSDYTGGLASAAEQLSAVAVFAPPPDIRPVALGRLRLWWLRRVLRRPLFTLGDGDDLLVWDQPADNLGTLARHSVGLR